MRPDRYTDNMIEAEVIPPGSRQTVAPKRSWLEAYKSFLTSGSEPTMLKLAPLALLGYLPIDILDEVVPFIGMLDDIPYVILCGYVIIMTLRRLERYRQP